MKYISYLLLVIIGLSSGGVISAGVFSFLTSIGVITRIAANVHCGKYIRIFENFLIAGGIIGGVISILWKSYNLGGFFSILYGVTTGIFVGCIVMSLAETLNSFAVFTKRVNLNSGFRGVIYAIALGKLCGSLFYFFAIV